MFNQLMDAIRVSLAQAIAGLFYIGVVAMICAFVATLFLEEIPLRKSHRVEAADVSGEAPLEGETEVFVEPAL
jgi:hypothetical protein